MFALHIAERREEIVCVAPEQTGEPKDFAVCNSPAARLDLGNEQRIDVPAKFLSAHSEVVLGQTEDTSPFCNILPHAILHGWQSARKNYSISIR